MIALLASPLVRYALVAAVSAGAAAAGTWHYAGLLADRKALEQAKATLVAINAAQAETIRLQGEKDAALERANRRAQANAQAASSARSELDGLRDDLAAALAGLPSLPHQACLDRASALEAVFAQCAGDLEGMARKAQGHANDAMTLDEAWPAPSQ